jgi:hypothetical protein
MLFGWFTFYLFIYLSFFLTGIFLFTPTFSGTQLGRKTRPLYASVRIQKARNISVN